MCEVSWVAVDILFEIIPKPRGDCDDESDAKGESGVLEKGMEKLDEAGSMNDDFGAGFMDIIGRIVGGEGEGSSADEDSNDVEK